MNPLLKLLQQSAGQVVAGGPYNTPGINPGAPGPEVLQDEILVNGVLNREPTAPQVDPYEGMNLNNRDAILERDAAAESTRDASQRRGMFGLKGTLRDVLGTIGDAFLVQGGGKAVYAPTRERERLGDAMAGYTRDPMAAAERAVGVNPEFGADFYQMAEQAQARQAQLESMEQSRQSQAQDRRWGNVKDATNMIARLLGSPQAQARPDVALAQAEMIARQAGVSLEELGITPGMTPEDMQLFSRRDMTVNQQEMLPRRDRQLEQGDRRLEQGDTRNAIAQQRANRPPAGRAPRAETSDERYIRIMDKPASQRTAGERAWIESQSGGSTRRRAPSRPRTPSGSSTRPRIRSVRDAD